MNGHKNTITIVIFLLLGLSSHPIVRGQRDSKMGIKASKEDVTNFINSHSGKEYFVFSESRTSPIQMLDSIPKCWCNRNEYEMEHFSAEARPGEFYTFQLGIYSPKIKLDSIGLSYTNLKNEKGQVIGNRAFKCFNLGGINEKGEVFSKVVNVSKGSVQPLWIGLQIPKEATGYYNGDFVVSARDAMPTTVHINIHVDGSIIPNSGLNEGWRMARLKWLDSDIAQDDSITKPYTPIKKDGLTMKILGRSLTLQPNGLPEKIQSYFSNSVTRIQESPHNILASPFQFIVETRKDSCKWVHGNLEFTHISEGDIRWEVESNSGDFILNCEGKIEYDGFVEYKLILKALRDVDLNDILLKIPLKEDAAKYFMGLGYKGGLRPRDFEWRWNIKKNQDALWIGDVNAGIRCKFKGANYKSPLVNIYYQFGPLNMPISWSNDGKGGISVEGEKPGMVLLEAFSGEHHMKKGECLHFDFELLITPLKPINVSKHFANRYIHRGLNRGSAEEMLDDAVKFGANVINVHHSKALNPFINYPYLDETVEDFKEFIQKAHEKHLKVKPYYTTREITVNSPEFWALWSLQGEVIFPGPGKDVRTVIHKNGPDSWLVKNLGKNFIPAWVQPLTVGKLAGSTDLSVITTPDTRWNNFYLGGLDWMVKNIHIDGIYIDDTALDRESLKRARKILDRNKSGCLIDLHSWNAFDCRAGWNNNANQYMELFPYIDRIWFGENFRYDDNLSDYWLVEISGIPFGLMGEMLQGGGNPWKGMVFGLTRRIYQEVDPVPVWNFIDQYELGNAEMIGYWDESCPVKTNNKYIKATAYRAKDFTVVSVANFSHKDQECLLGFDLKLLGFKENSVEIFSPFIKDFQEGKKYIFNNTMKIESDKGALLIIRDM